MRHSTADSRTRWYRLTPDRFVIGLLAVEMLLWLSERFDWLPFNHYKGCTVLLALASVGVTMLVMLLWFVASLIFRWRFQFGIRSLLVLTVAVAVACSWLAVNLRNAQKQKATVAVIRTSVGAVWYDWQPDEDDLANPFRDVPDADSLRTRVRACLYKWFGQDFVSDVVSVGRDFSTDKYRAICDADLEHFRDLSRLQTLQLHGTIISDAGLAALAGLTRLETLDLSGTPITDAGLEHLKALTRLRDLELWETSVTDAGLERLRGLARLETLELGHTPVTNAGLEHLNALSRLKTLGLFETWVDEAGVAGLKGQLPDVEVTFSTRLTTADGEAIRRLLDRTAEFHGQEVVEMEPAVGGGVEVTLRVPPHHSGPAPLLKKTGGQWEIVKPTRVWIGGG